MRFRRELHPSGTTLAVFHHDPAHHQDRWVPLASVFADRRPSPDLRAVYDDLVALLAGGIDLREEIRRICDRTAGVRYTGGIPILPFQPDSLRCFAGWQAHWEQAARNLARRYHPLARRVIPVYEGLTRRTFPPLRPRPEFFAQPAYYTGNHLTLFTDGETVPWPGYCRDLDFELEIGVVLTRALLDATPAQGEAAIGGFVVFNDLSARDTQWYERTDGLFGPVIKAKTFASALSAEVVTADEVLPHIDDLAATVAVNGEIWSRTSTRGMQHSLGAMVARASEGEEIQAGELLTTGTLPRGCGLELDRWVQPGDVVELAVERIGVLRSVIGKRGS